MVIEETKEEQSPLPADCLLVRSKKEACEDKIDQPTEGPPVEESTQISERSEHYKILNIHIFDNYFIDECQSVGCVNVSVQVEKCVQLKFCLDFLQPDLQSVFSNKSFWLGFLLFVFALCLHCVRCAHQKGLEAGFSSLLQIMFLTLTPRHLLSLIWRLMGCCCVAKASFLVLFILFGSLISQSDAGSLIITKQDLPRECYAWFTIEGEDCPVKADWDPSWDNRWGKLNYTCCSSFPGTELHCQRQGTANFPACLPELIVDRGLTGRLMKGDDGNPQFKTVPCNSTMAYESDPTVSSNVTFSYCLRLKSRCNGVGEKHLCDGGTVADDLCTCSTGYRPIGEGCHGSFTDQDECQCVPFTCAADESPVPTPNQIGFCVDLMKDRVVPQFGCESFSAPTLPPAEAGQNQSNVSMPDQSENTFTPVSHPIGNVTDESTVLPNTREIHDDTGILYDVAGWFVFVLMILFLGSLCGSAYIANMEDDEHWSLPFLGQCSKSVS